MKRFACKQTLEIFPEWACVGRGGVWHTARYTNKQRVINPNYCRFPIGLGGGVVHCHLERVQCVPECWQMSATQEGTDTNQCTPGSFVFILLCVCVYVSVIVHANTNLHCLGEREKVWRWMALECEWTNTLAGHRSKPWVHLCILVCATLSMFVSLPLYQV